MDRIGRREVLDLRFREVRTAGLAEGADRNVQLVAIGADFLVDLEAALQLRLVVGSE